MELILAFIDHICLQICVVDPVLRRKIVTLGQNSMIIRNRATIPLEAIGLSVDTKALSFPKRIGLDLP
ncbi:MAG: hypothetical protein JRI34_08805 [Deltaproteobacteria bacterium]|nr:hypothetical protein [Deltaproteobacteria bacterium]